MESRGVGLPKISVRGDGLPIFEPEGPDVGALGTVLENFWQIFVKSGLKCYKINLRKKLDSKFFKDADCESSRKGVLGGKCFCDFSFIKPVDPPFPIVLTT